MILVYPFSTHPNPSHHVVQRHSINTHSHSHQLIISWDLGRRWKNKYSCIRLRSSSEEFLHLWSDLPKPSCDTLPVMELFIKSGRVLHNAGMRFFSWIFHKFSIEFISGDIYSSIINDVSVSIVIKVASPIVNFPTVRKSFHVSFFFCFHPELVDVENRIECK